MNKREFIKRAIDANAFVYNNGVASEGVKVNPKIWDARLRDFEEKALVVTPLAEQFDFRGPGADYQVTIDDRPSAAGALTETVDVSVSAFTTSTVTFTPAEYGDSYQLTRKEAVRSFFDLGQRMVRKLGYALAEKKDSVAIGVLGGASTQIIANSKSATSDLTSTDLLNLSLISDGYYQVRANYFKPRVLIINPHQETQLRTQSNTITLADASQFGTREMIERGFVSRLFGLDVYTSDVLPVTSNVVEALVLGETRSGEKAFGYAIKRDPIIEREYHARGRFWDIVAHEEYDFKLLHDGAVCRIATYSA